MYRRATLPIIALLLVSVMLAALSVPRSVPVAFAQDVLPTSTPTSTATLIPTPLPVSTIVYATLTPVGGCFPPKDLWIGREVYLRSGVNIRHQPGFSGAPVAYTTENIDAIIIAGPVCISGYNWWRVAGPKNPGWIAEGSVEAGDFIIPYPREDPAAACEGAYDLAVGQTAELFNNVKVHESPGKDALVKTVAQAGQPVEIIGGPQCVDNYYWWQVRATVAGFTYTGWMAEGDQGLYWLAPQGADLVSECAAPLDFGPGTRGAVFYRDGSPKYLRSAPGTNAPALFSLVNNVPFEVVGGPVCRDDLNWWQIRVLASQEVVGWMAEGSPGVGYWMDERDDLYQPYPMPPDPPRGRTVPDDADTNDDPGGN